jgi:hypothetical protein
MLQEFNVTDFEEINETEEIYNIMNKRILYCKNTNTADEPHGPADICYIVKESQSKNFLGFGSKKISKVGSYHYVYGLDTSNLAYISAYISKYIQKQTQSNFKVTQAIFCIFDYFLEKDLRILIKFPGGIKKIFYIDDQQAIEANPDELRTVYLSTIIRSWNIDRVNNHSIYLEEISHVDSFNFIKDSIKALVKSNLLLTIDNSNSEFKYTNIKTKMAVLLDGYIKYLMNTRRFNYAIMFFNERKFKF